MGKIRMEGVAVRECKYDLMELMLTFHVKEKSTAAALKAVTEQCERFLKKLDQEGLMGPFVRYVDDDTRKTDKIVGAEVIAKRKICIRYEYSLALVNHLMEMIQETKWDIEIEPRFLLSEDKQRKEELIMEAVRDSRHKAELIADAAGVSISGIDDISISDNTREWGYHDEEDCYEDDEDSAHAVFGRGKGGTFGRSKTKVTDGLQGPLKRIKVTADIDWLVTGADQKKADENSSKEKADG